MKSLRLFAIKHKRALAIGMSVFALALVFSVGSGANTALAACPGVPADCTIDDIVGTNVDTVVDTTVAFLVTNLPIVLAGALGIMLAFKLIKLAMSWTRKFIR